MGVPTPTVSVAQDGWDAESSSTGSGFVQTEETLRAILTEGEPLPTAPDPDAEEAPEADASAATETDPETETPAVAEPPAPEATAEEPKKPEAKAKEPRQETAKERKARLQAEINAHVREREEVRRQIAAEQRRLADLRASATPAPAPSPTTSTPPVAPSPSTQAQTFAEPEPEWATFDEQGKTFDEYQKEHRKWDDRRLEFMLSERDRQTRAQIEREQREHAIRTQQEQAARAHDERIAKARAAHPDFDQVVKTNLKDVPQVPFVRDLVRHHPAGAEVLYQLGADRDLAIAVADVFSRSATNAMVDAVVSMENPMPLLAYFAERPEEADRIADMPPRLALVALGKLTSRLEPAKTGSGSTATVSSAPDPIRPIGGGRSTAPSRKSLDELDYNNDAEYAEWVRRTNEEEKKRSARRT